MQYDIVFDASNKPFEWWPTLAALALGLLFLLVERLNRSWSKAHRKIFCRSMAAVCLVFGAMIFILMRSSYSESRGKLRSGRFEVVEGCVEDLHPMPVRGGELESFSVHGIKFTYSDYESTPGYNRTISHGGVIGKDLMVRISYATDNEISPPRNVILKLEISRNRTKCSAE